MDQSAFRNILASGPSKAPATGRAAGVLGGQTLKRGYASGNRASNFAPKEQADKGESSKPVLAPRKVKKKDGKYKDRAEMRRLGLEDEFKPIERMVDDFEERAKAEGENDEAIAAKRAYLGGDAEHSALFKGLDYSLLEVRKAELAAEEGTKLDDELDKVLEHALPLEEARAEAGPGPSTTGQKRTREEIMEALQTSRKRLALDGDGTKKKKKPKGDDAAEMVAAAPALGSRFKKIASIPAEADGKKKKKKKKAFEVAPASVPVITAPAAPQPGLMIISAKADMPESPAVLLERENRIKAEQLRRRSVTPPVVRFPSAHAPSPESAVPMNNPAPAALSATPAPAALPKPVAVPAPVLDSDEEDIFGGVSDYEMDLGSDSDDEGAKPVKPKTAPDAPAVTTKKGKGWFGDEEEEEQAAPSDSMLPSILRSTKAVDDSAQRMASRSPSPEDGTLRRLQPLTSSRVPSAKQLLAMDKAAAENEKRREKKAKWRAKQGLTAQEGAGEDDGRGGDQETEKERENAEKNKLHVEQQRLEAYMNKKKQA